LINNYKKGIVNDYQAKTKIKMIKNWN